MKRVILYISCILLGSGLFAQNKVYTLQECLQEGLENNYSLKIEKNTQRISDNNATLGNAGFLPTISASGKYSGSAQDNETKVRDTKEIVEENNILNQTMNAGVNLNWTLFQGFNVTTNYKKLKELQAQGAKIVLDSKSFTIDDIFDVAPWLIKPNQEEISEYLGCEVDTIEDAAQKASVFAIFFKIFPSKRPNGQNPTPFWA